MTYEEMCETIAWVQHEWTGETLDPHDDIFCMSPTGELWPVHDAYEVAEAWLLDGLPGAETIEQRTARILEPLAGP